MEEKIRKIISIYTKIPEDLIVAETIIDRTSVSSSILLHRMYGKLANEGFIVEDGQYGAAQWLHSVAFQQLLPRFVFDAANLLRLVQNTTTG